MRVAILCTCAEPGRDGVGDCSVRLASALRAQGHEALVIAERDWATAGPTPEIVQRENVKVVRLPVGATDARRAQWLEEELADFRPDWVLLQFVCWGFAPRGVLDPAPMALLSALAGRRVAVYCHELWLGLERGTGFRHRWWGRSQRRSILRFLSMLKPAAVLTSNPTYGAILQRFGWKAHIVPLPSNIPVHEAAADQARRLIEQRLGRAPWSEREDALVLAVFGTVFPGWKPEGALHWLQTEAGRRNRKAMLVSIGRPSQKGEALLRRLARDAGAALSVVMLGEAASPVVSGLLQLADVGLPSSGWLLLGKSGVAAAMHSHGLPMLVVRQEPGFRDLPGFSVTHAPSVFRFDAQAPPDFDRLIGARRPALDTLSELARQHVSVLEHAR